ncbi:hypothetical protein [Vreelandella glaciei]|uniref:hypothetical protein n=1 Tax=Vreelandella glaciei TaxID=186761 RepID=UPI0030EC76F3|tara:strand:- start:107 stop:760 length:654 start_codon:yes stop_codon:yes gene_type:complete
MMTEDKVQVIDRVREYLREQLSDFSKEKSEQMAVLYFINTTGTRTVYHPDKGYSTIEVTGEYAADLVELAKEDWCAWEAARRLCSVLIDKEGNISCPELRYFASQRMVDKFPKPKVKGAWGNLSRDLPIAMAVHILNKRAGINPWRNEVTYKHSDNGFEVVSAILKDIGYEVSARAVENTWERYADHVRGTACGGPYYFQSSGKDLKLRKSHSPKKG